MATGIRTGFTCPPLSPPPPFPTTAPSPLCRPVAPGPSLLTVSGLSGDEGDDTSADVPEDAGEGGCGAAPACMRATSALTAGGWLGFWGRLVGQCAAHMESRLSPAPCRRFPHHPRPLPPLFACPTCIVLLVHRGSFPTSTPPRSEDFAWWPPALFWSPLSSSLSPQPRPRSTLQLTDTEGHYHMDHHTGHTTYGASSHGELEAMADAIAEIAAHLPAHLPHIVRVWFVVDATVDTHRLLRIARQPLHKATATSLGT